MRLVGLADDSAQNVSNVADFGIGQSSLEALHFGD